MRQCSNYLDNILFHFQSILYHLMQFLQQNHRVYFLQWSLLNGKIIREYSLAEIRQILKDETAKNVANELAE